MSILIAILVFGLIVFIHELGHFIAAKFSGVTVYRFSIGFGPALIKKEFHGTLYAIRLLPLGGSVAMKGEYDDEGNEIEDPTGSFNNAKLSHRFLIAFAGSFMNFLMGFVLIVITLWPAQALPTRNISGLAEGFPYGGEQGLQVGDEILQVNDVHIFLYGDIASALQLGAGEPYDITVRRDGKKVELQDLPLEPQEYVQEDGTTARHYGLQFAVEEATVGNKLRYSVNNTGSFMQSVVLGLKQIFSGQVERDDVMGTVGIANEISNRAKTSALDMWYFVAFLSVNLSIMNLLPIPGLDGGKILFLLIELVRRKPVPAQYEGIVQVVGLVLIFGLFLFVTYNDIVRLIAG
ncbi:MAG TPA: site-2 protease family protein [Firmicutes bacterium]|nr:site-2 protease family protein [Bacillota bacterium]